MNKVICSVCKRTIPNGHPVYIAELVVGIRKGDIGYAIVCGRCQHGEGDDMATKEQRIVKGLRERMGLTEDDITDRELLAVTKGTLSRSFVELDIAQEDFAEAKNVWLSGLRKE